MKTSLFTTLVRMIGCAVCIPGIILLSFHAQALAQAGSGVIRVAPTGSDVSGCGSAASPCRTIQYAVTIASSGDTIKLAQGTYTGSGSAVVTLNKNLTIIGGYSVSDWENPSSDPSLTVIDGQNARRGILLSDVAVTVAIRGLTIQNGFNNTPLSGGEFIGGGLLCRTGSASGYINLSLSNVVFKNNRVQGSGNGAVGGGGAGFYQNCRTTMENVTFENNQAIGGDAPNTGTRGAHALGGGFFATTGSDVTATGLYLNNNLAQAGSGGDGTGSSDWDTADGLGGGAAMQLNKVALYWVFANGNRALGGSGSAKGGTAAGGALFFEKNTDQVVIANGVLRGNSATGGASGNAGGVASGGAIMSTDSRLWLERLYIIHNTSTGGAGADGGDAGGGGLYFTRVPDPWGASSTVTGINLIIADNRAEAGAGANRWGGGGGVFSQNTDLTFSHVTLAGNTILDTMTAPGLISLNYPGSGIGGSTARLYYSIVANHTGAVSWSPAVMAQSSGDTLVLDYTLFYNNNNSNYGGGGSVSNTHEVPSGNPAFVSPGAPSYYYHIGRTSAARDRATGSTVAVDIDGENRPAGAAADVGADEYQLQPAHLSVSTLVTPGNIKAGGSVSHAVTRQIRITNTGAGAATTVSLTDQLPTPSAPLGLSLSSGPTCSSGTCNYNADTRRVTWSGNVPAGGEVTISYGLTVNVPTNYAQTTALIFNGSYNYTDESEGSGSGTFMSAIIINGRQVYLPLVQR